MSAGSSSTHGTDTTNSNQLQRQEGYQHQKGSQSGMYSGVTEQQTSVPLWARAGNKQLFSTDVGDQTEARGFLKSLLSDPYTAGEGQNNRFGAAVNRLFDTQLARARSGDSQNIGTAKAGFREGSALTGSQDSVIGQGMGAAGMLLQDANPYESLQYAQSTGKTTGKQSGTTFGENEGLTNQAGTTRTNGRSQTNSGTSTSGAGITICCFIFIATYYGKPLPREVRLARDLFCSNERVAGYRRMARWLVPLMHASPAITLFVRAVMTKPLELWAGWIFGTRRTAWGAAMYPLVAFWFMLWQLTGRAEDLCDYPEEAK